MLLPVSSHPPARRVAWPPVATLPVVTAGHPTRQPVGPPAEGSLAWLLAYGMEPEALLHSTVTLADARQPDPGVQQALRHAQQFCAVTAAVGRKDERFASPLSMQPFAVSRPASTDASQVAFGVLAEAFTARVAQAMPVPRPDPENRPHALRTDMKKILARAWLLDLPVDPKLAALIPDQRDAARFCSIPEVFGRSRAGVHAVLDRACSDTLAQLGADRMHAADPLKPACQQAAAELRDYHQECLFRLEAMPVD